MIYAVIGLCLLVIVGYVLSPDDETQDSRAQYEKLRGRVLENLDRR